MGLLNFFIAPLLFLAGLGVGSLIDFDWKTFWQYRLQKEEMAMKYMKEGDANAGNTDKG